MQRRQFLQTVTVGSALILAGCSGGGDGGGQGTTTATPGGADGGGDEVDATPTPTARTTTDPSTGTTTEAESTEPGMSTPPADEATPTQGSTGQITMSEAIAEFVDNYRYAVDLSNYQGGSTDTTMEGAWHGSDFVTHATVEGESISIYDVDGTMYLDASGYCTPVQGTGGTQLQVDPEEWASTDDAQARVEDWADLTPTGETTIDGEAVWIFAVEAGELGNEYAYRYYVSQSSGFLRRVETQGVVIDYWDWGNVDPIQPPC